jgi:hypothetical protein
MLSLLPEGAVRICGDDGAIAVNPCNSIMKAYRTVIQARLPVRRIADIYDCDAANSYSAATGLFVRCWKAFVTSLPI